MEKISDHWWEGEFQRELSIYTENEYASSANLILLVVKIIEAEKKDIKQH